MTTDLDREGGGRIIFFLRAFSITSAVATAYKTGNSQK